MLEIHLKMSNEISIMDQLREAVEGWDLSVKLRNGARQVAKNVLKEREKDLKDAKRVLYLTTKAWNEARAELKTSKNRLTSYPSTRRRWAKQNIGKVLDMIDKQNTHFCQGKKDGFESFCAECKAEKKK